ncbi:MAG: MBL fold metallo-hydrolase [Gemmatimonadales bacterium]
MTLNDTTLDLRHLGRDRYVGSELLITSAGPVLLDVGPGSTLPALETGLAAAGLRIEDLHAVLLSHIHFDHAGAAGLLVERNPALPIFVHERGARHLHDPSRLIASATRIYGDRMDTLWGRLAPIPLANLRTLTGGETLEFGDRRFEVTAAPGHAVHHVVYFERATATAYLGDNGGVNVPALPLTLPVTPPPDFDLEAWLATIDRIEALGPERLWCTHFGFSPDPRDHLPALRAGLIAWVAKGKELLADDGTDTDRASRFHDWALASLSGRADDTAIRRFADFAAFGSSFDGIARYLRRPPAA